MAFRHLPLKTHEYAREAALLSICAEGPGLFWPVHDAFFADSAIRSPGAFRQRAIAAGMDGRRLDRCVSGKEAQSRLAADLELAMTLGVQGTPVFFVGQLTAAGVVVRRVLVGAQPFKDMSAAIDSIVSSR